MVNNLVFRWPKPLFFMVLGAHGIYIYRYTYIYGCHDSWMCQQVGAVFPPFFCASPKDRLSTQTRWWFQSEFIFTPIIFFKWVGSTTNQQTFDILTLGILQRKALRG